MSIDKTLSDTFRRDLSFDKYEVDNILPGHFDEKYPRLAAFLKKYYESLEDNANPVSDIKKLLVSRDIVQTRTEFLTFIASELLLGKPYFESFNDKRSALQYSNLLYRSKGTEFSIRQFFRIFYGVDVDVEYGRERVFYIGDPRQETFEYVGESGVTGTNFDFTYPNAVILVFVEEEDGSFIQLTEGVHYTTNYDTKQITLIQHDSPLSSTTYMTTLSQTALLSDGQTLRIISDRRYFTAIGADVTDKRLTNDKFFQLYGLLISTPLSVKIWIEAYKTFVHPAGMFIGGEVDITSVFDLNLGLQPPAFITPPPPLLIQQTANLSTKQNTKGLLTTNITEIGPGPNGYRVQSRPNDMFHPRTIEKWHLQYGSMADADDINARTMDDSYADLSNDFNLLDEDIWHFDYLHPVDSDGAGNRTPIFGYNEPNEVEYERDLTWKYPNDSVLSPPFP